ncbi:MAG TPA: sialidase family protein [Mycobacteriales bacterium]|jgi:hypothetical protein|nr:sialidase family protein [Mycobacteriales bacterium]
MTPTLSPAARRRLAAATAAAGLALLAAAGTATATTTTAAPKVTGTPVRPRAELPEARPQSLVGATATGRRNTFEFNLGFANAAKALPMRPATWREAGPKGIVAPEDYSGYGARYGRSTGNGTALAVDPSDPTGNTVYYGTLGGLFKSTDGGAHSTPVTDKYLGRAAIGAVAVDADNPSDVWVGSGVAFFSSSGDAGGTGVYVSHDGGKTFSRPARNVRGYGVQSIAVDDSGVFVATTDGLFHAAKGSDAFADTMLPTNAAHTAPSPLKFGNWVTAVVTHPNNANEITAAVGFPAGKIQLLDGKASEGNGLYRSTDGGTTWAYLAGTSGLTNPAATDDPIGRTSLAYSQGDAPVLWALVSDAGKLNGANEQIPTSDVPLVGTSTTLNGLYRSADDGATWTLKANEASLLAAPNSTVAALAAIGYGPGVQSWYNNWVGVDPTDPSRVFFGLEEVYQVVANADGPGPAEAHVIQRYADVCGFVTYTQGITNGYPCPDTSQPEYNGLSTHPDQHSWAIATKDAGGIRLYTGNDGGFWHQDSHDSTTEPGGFDNDGWIDANTIGTALVYHAAMGPDGTIVAGLQDNGTVKITPNKEYFSVCGGDGFEVQVTPDPNVFYCSYVQDKLYVTTDAGKNTKDIDPGLTGALFSAPYAIDPLDANHLVAAGNDLKETTKGAATSITKDPLLGTMVDDGDWVTSFTKGASPTKNAAGNPVNWQSSAVAVQGPVVYDGACGACSLAYPGQSLLNAVFTNAKPGCEAKTGAADCWHKAAGQGLVRGNISRIAIDPKDTSTVYVTVTSGNTIGFDAKSTGGDGRVFVSHDCGEHFTDLTGNLPRSGANAVIVRGDNLIVAGDDGVFIGPKSGLVWQRLGQLPKASVRDVRNDTTGRYVVAATYGRGVWVLDVGAKAPGTGVFVPKPPAKHTGGGTGTGGTKIPSTGLNDTLAAAGVLLLALAAWLRRGTRRA